MPEPIDPADSAEPAEVEPSEVEDAEEDGDDVEGFAMADTRAGSRAAARGPRRAGVKMAAGPVRRDRAAVAEETAT